ncbi:MAG TPA: Bax inhibitor-1/YccA family protein [Rhodanobacteraceae bacterium]
MRSTNPVLRRQTFENQAVSGERMTMNGTVMKTALLLVLAVITGAWTWHHFTATLTAAMAQMPLDMTPAQAQSAVISQALGAVTPFMLGGIVVGLVLTFVMMFKPRWGGIVAPVYALAEGLALGGISAVMNLKYPNVVLQAVMLTAGVLAVMLIAYRSGWIRVTDKFRMAVVAGTGAIMLLYLVEIGLHAFTSVSIPFINGSGVIGIGFSLLVVGLAAMNLALDFDMIEQNTTRGAPKYMEWYGAFALMVTLVWLYLEILRLLAKTRR